MDTKALVTLCQKGNGQALSLLYENYSEKIAENGGAKDVK